MGISCNGVCHRYKAIKPMSVGRYASGQKRCNSCEIFINWDGLWCPCCGMALRTRPRTGKNKKSLRKLQLIQK